MCARNAPRGAFLTVFPTEVNSRAATACRADLSASYSVRDSYDTEHVTGAMRLNGTILFQEFELNQVHRLDAAQCL